MATTKNPSSPQPICPLHRESGFRLFNGADQELNPFTGGLITVDPLTDDQQLALLEMAEPAQALATPEPSPEPAPDQEQEENA